MKVILVIFSIIALGISRTEAQDTALLTRTPYKLTLNVDGKSFYEEDIKAIPYLFPNRSVQMYPGETIYLEIDMKDGLINEMKPVRENSNPEKTLVLKFVQNSEKKVHQSMMLTVKNPFHLTLTYESLIFPFKYKKWVSTNVYPVQPELSGIEVWPDLLTSIALGNWTFKTDKP